MVVRVVCRLREPEQNLKGKILANPVLLQELKFRKNSTINLVLRFEGKGTSAKIKSSSDTNSHSWKQNIMLLLAIRKLDDQVQDDAPSSGDSRKVWMCGSQKDRAVFGPCL